MKIRLFLSLIFVVAALALVQGPQIQQPAPSAHCNDDPPPCPGGVPCVRGKCIPPP